MICLDPLEGLIPHVRIGPKQIGQTGVRQGSTQWIRDSKVRIAKAGRTSDRSSVIHNYLTTLLGRWLRNLSLIALRSCFMQDEHMQIIGHATLCFSPDSELQSCEYKRHLNCLRRRLLNETQGNTGRSSGRDA